jgi:hypothetical protein
MKRLMGRTLVPAVPSPKTWEVVVEWATIAQKVLSGTICRKSLKILGSLSANSIVWLQMILVAVAANAL